MPSTQPDAPAESITPPPALDERAPQQPEGMTEPSANDALILPAAQMRPARGAGAYLHKVWIIASKDLRIEMRAKEILGAMAAFSVLAVVIFGLAFDLVPRVDLLVPGVLWSILLFAGVLGLHRSFGAEIDRGSLAALLLLPLDRSVIYFGKVVANLIFMLISQALVLPVILILFDVNLFQGWIFVGIVLGVVGYVGVGTLFAALTASVRARETMLPILLLPVMAPLFLAGVALTGDVLAGNDLNDFRQWLIILVAYDLIFLTIAYMVFDLIWEEA